LQLAPNSLQFFQLLLQNIVIGDGGEPVKLTLKLKSLKLKSLKRLSWPDRLWGIAIMTLGLVVILNGRPQAMATNLEGQTWTGASFPVENFQAYTSPFGFRHSPTGGRGYEFHSGLDIAAPEGSYIRSWWGGTVVEVINDSGCGVGLVIESGDWEHIYCHLGGQVQTHLGRRTLIDRRGGIQVVEGQSVPSAARIARVGMSGRTTGPHLHWGLRYGDRWVDPALVLRAMHRDR
jgi:murein DD-endopeptidase MepM/ murein hydrolase activator NlpD